MPKEPLNTADLSALGLPELAHLVDFPIIYGTPKLTITPDRIECGIDIFGSIFFMLSRFEEVVQSNRDDHDRFPAAASLAFREDFLFRPIADEYVELLWALMKRLWPGLERKKRQGRVKITCDVDQPFDRAAGSPYRLIRALAGDLIRRRDPSLALRRSLNCLIQKTGNLHFDPFYTFDWYLDECEKSGHKAAFYFIADHSGGAIDGSYHIEEPRILALLRKISERGHEIGMHGSYNTFRDPAQLRHERKSLLLACQKAGIDAMISGNRQHYLRWDTSETPEHLEAAGFEYDTSGSYADRPGFRFGTSQTFPMWGWQRMSPLKLWQQPLIMMEQSVMSPKYMGLSQQEECLGLLLDLKQKSLSNGGYYTILWHNSELYNDKQRVLFATSIAGEA
jgi:hypothetical protein